MIKKKQSDLAACILAVNSNSSVNSVDVVLTAFNQPEPHTVTLELLGHASYPISNNLRKTVFDACAGRNSIVEICELNFWLGEVFAETSQNFLKDMGKDPSQIDLIASHGQTIYHQFAAGHRHSTLQFGEATQISSRTGITVASNFRVSDVSVGGQGAPLVSYFDYLFFHDKSKSRATLNISGITNITYLPADEQNTLPIAFDTGPGTMLIDYAVRYYTNNELFYDKDGLLARAGEVNQELFQELMNTYFLKEKPPKSTGREVFGDVMGKEIIWAAEQRDLTPQDVVATLTAFTVESIAQAHRDYGPSYKIDEFILSGGGTRNPVLREGLITKFPGATIRLHEEFGIPVEYREGEIFALLGYELLRGHAANIPCCTGATHPALLGQLTPGANYTDLLQRFVPYMDNEATALSKPNTNYSNWLPSRRLILKS